jgi:hypothetical protein
MEILVFWLELQGESYTEAFGAPFKTLAEAISKAYELANSDAFWFGIPTGYTVVDDAGDLVQEGKFVAERRLRRKARARQYDRRTGRKDR